MIQYKKGDARISDDQINTYLVHICNDQHFWSMGFAKALAEHYPIAREIYMQEELSLGDIQCVKIHDNLSIINMIAQKGIISKDNPQPIDYEALELCLEKTFQAASKEKARIQMPKIGSGLAGGNWKKISRMLEKKQKEYNLQLIVYTLD